MHIRKFIFWKYILFLLIIFVTTCGVGDQNSEVTPVATSLPEVDVQEILERSSNAMMGIQTAKFHISHVNGYTQIMDGILMTNADGEFVSPHNMSIIFDGEMSSGFYVKSGFKIVNDEVFMLNPFREDEWELLPPEINPFRNFDPIESIGLMLENLDRVVRIQPDGKTQHYFISAEIETEFVAPVFGLAGLPNQSTQIELKINSIDYFINEVRLLGPIGTTDAENIIREIIFFDIDEPLLIRVP